MVKFESLKGDILHSIPAATRVLEGRNDVVFAYLFGGLAEGRVNPLSDVDIAAYLGDRIAGHLARLSLFEELTDALGTSELDLVILNTAPTSLAGRVLSNRRVLVDKNPFFRQGYESRIFREYFDFQYLENDFFTRRFGDG